MSAAAAAAAEGRKQEEGDGKGEEGRYLDNMVVISWNREKGLGKGRNYKEESDIEGPRPNCVRGGVCTRTTTGSPESSLKSRRIVTLYVMRQKYYFPHLPIKY